MKGRIPAVVALVAVLAGAGTAFAAFTPEGSPYPVGNDPYGIVAGDFNGDARPDFAAVNGTSSNLSVFLRQPAGGFAQESGSPFAVAPLGGPNHAAVADYNGDSLLDVAVANFSTSNITVLLRQAGGGFVQESSSPVPGGGQLSGIVSADFNRDGRPDLVVNQIINGRVTVLLRTPANTGFAEEGNGYPTGGRPAQLAVGNFNGDPLPDVAVANSGSSNVTILLRVVGGFVAETPAIPVGTRPLGITASDFNGDGLDDLAVSNVDSSNVSILLRKGTNDGFAQESGSPITVAAGPLGVASADFDADGRRDLAVAANTAGSVTVLRRNAGGGFSADPPTPVNRAYGLAIADFDGDRRFDLAVTSDSAPGAVTILRDPAPVVQPPSPTPTATPVPVPPPVVGKSVNASRVEGTVKVKVPGSSRFEDLDKLRHFPVGTTFDTRKGRVTIVAAEKGKTAKADFYDGLFKLSQTKGSKPVTTLTLTEALSCGSSKKASAAAGKKTRKLWGNGKGTFRTKGRYSAATVRGTQWLTQDRCDSTLIRVKQGSVSVRDNVKRKTVIVRAPRSYTARRKR